MSEPNHNLLTFYYYGARVGVMVSSPCGTADRNRLQIGKPKNVYTIATRTVCTLCLCTAANRLRTLLAQSGRRFNHFESDRKLCLRFFAPPVLLDSGFMIETVCLPSCRQFVELTSVLIQPFFDHIAALILPFARLALLRHRKPSHSYANQQLIYLISHCTQHCKRQ